MFDQENEKFIPTAGSPVWCTTDLQSGKFEGWGIVLKVKEVNKYFDANLITDDYIYASDQDSNTVYEVTVVAKDQDATPVTFSTTSFSKSKPIKKSKVVNIIDDDDAKFSIGCGEFVDPETDKVDTFIWIDSDLEAVTLVLKDPTKLIEALKIVTSN